MLFMRGPGLPVLVPSFPEFQEITERDGGSDRHRSECVLDLLVVVAVDGLVHRLDDRHRRIEVGPNDLAIRVRFFTGLIVLPAWRSMRSGRQTKIVQQTIAWLRTSCSTYSHEDPIIDAEPGD